MNPNADEFSRIENKFLEGGCAALWKSYNTDGRQEMGQTLGTASHSMLPLFFTFVEMIPIKEKIMKVDPVLQAAIDAQTLQRKLDGKFYTAAWWVRDHWACAGPATLAEATADVARYKANNPQKQIYEVRSIAYEGNSIKVL